MGKYNRTTLILTLRVTGNFLPERPKNNYPLERLSLHYFLSSHKDQSFVVLPSFSPSWKLTSGDLKRKGGYLVDATLESRESWRFALSSAPHQMSKKKPSQKVGSFRFLFRTLVLFPEKMFCATWDSYICYGYSNQRQSNWRISFTYFPQAAAANQLALFSPACMNTRLPINAVACLSQNIAFQRILTWSFSCYSRLELEILQGCCISHQPVPSAFPNVCLSLLGQAWGD